ncbi:hypothetical protein N8D56_07455 [Devosia sp. A8/3-2]|nr:hypothetical protein N8D56_07455 [Devosia sp. A8/3-2]
MRPPPRIRHWRLVAVEQKKSFASLLLGTKEDGKLIYRGRVGTGFDAESAEALQQQLDKLARKTKPFSAVPGPVARTARWVAPDLVAEIGYAEFTPDGVLRHPSFLGLREDKPAGEVVLEQPAVAAPQKASWMRKPGLRRRRRAGSSSPAPIVWSIRAGASPRRTSWLIMPRWPSGCCPI